METLPPATAGQAYVTKFDSAGIEVWINDEQVTPDITFVGGKYIYTIPGEDVALPGPIRFKNGGQIVAEAEIQQA